MAITLAYVDVDDGAVALDGVDVVAAAAAVVTRLDTVRGLLVGTNTRLGGDAMVAAAAPLDDAAAFVAEDASGDGAADAAPPTEKNRWWCGAPDDDDDVAAAEGIGEMSAATEVRTVNGAALEEGV